MRVDGFTPAVGATANVNVGSDVLSKLKPGDTVRAQVIENSGSELTLKLSDGSKVSASAMSPVNAADGEYVNFVYKGTVDGKPALEVANRNIQPHSDATLDNIKSTLSELKLPITDRNIELAQALKGQNVPVTADSMSKIMDLVSKNVELKPDSAAFLAAANLANDKNSIEKLQSLLAGRLKISNDIGELIKLINGDSNSSAADVKSAIVNNILEKLAAQVMSKGINQANSATVLNKGGVAQSTSQTTINANTSTNTIGTTANATGVANANSVVSANSAANANGAANTSSAANASIVAGANSAANVGIEANTSNATTVVNSSNVASSTSSSSKASTNNQNNSLGATTISTTSNSNTLNVNNSALNINSNMTSSELINSNEANNNANNVAMNTKASDINSTSDNSSSEVAKQISNLFRDAKSLGSADLPLLHSLSSKLEAMVSSGALSIEEQSAAKLIAKEIGFTIFKIQGKEAILDQDSSVAKNLKSFEEAVNNLKTLFVKIGQDSDEINPVKLYKNMDNAIHTLKNSIMQLPMAMQETAMNIANNLESNANFINQLNNYSSYVQLPLSIFNQNTTGELYMLKKGSKSKKLDPSKLTILISLDSNNIGRIDTLLSIDKKNVSTNFRLKSNEVFEVFKENHKLLYTSLIEKGFRLVDFTYRLIDEPINIVNFEAEAKKEFIKNSNNIDILI